MRGPAVSFLRFELQVMAEKPLEGAGAERKEAQANFRLAFIWVP